MGIRLIIYATLFFALTSCNTIDYPITKDGQGYLSLEVINSDDITLVSKAGADHINDFTVEISRGNEVVKTFPAFGSITNPLLFNVGDYSVKAFYGTNNIAAYDSPYYEGNENFSIRYKETTKLDIKCIITNAIISPTYTDEFKKYYSDFSIEVASDEITTPLQISSTETRTLYVKPNTFSFTLKAKDLDGNDFTKTFINNIVSKNTKVTLKFDVNPKDHAISMELSESLIDIDGGSSDIDKDLFPKPYITTTFVEDKIVVYETATVNSVVNIKSAYPIDDCSILITSSDPFLAGVAGKTISLKSGEASDLSTLSTLGFNWSDLVSGSCVNGNLDISNLTPNLATDNFISVTSTLEVKVKDVTGKESEKTITLNVNPPTFMAPVVNEGSVWSKTTYLSAISKDDMLNGVNIDRLGASNFSLQMRKTGSSDSDWNTVSNLTVTELTPNTSYDYRAIYKGQITSNDVKTFVTETQIQIPNSGFEEWGVSSPKSGNEYFTLGGDWWETRNYQTYMYDTGSNYSEKQKSYCGTRRVTDKRSGDYAAEVRTTGWGSANTWPVASFWWFGVRCDNATPGALFTGNFSGGYGDGNMVAHTFNTRPTAVQFYYKYFPQVNDQGLAYVQVYSNGTVIATSNTVRYGSQGNWTQSTLPLTYSNEKLKATHILIKIMSGTKSDGKNTFEKKDRGTNAPFYGATIIVDDLSLIYDK